MLATAARRRGPGGRAAGRWHSDVVSANPLGYHRWAMPIYEYRCKKGHTFEVMQKISEDPVTTCEVCGSPVQRVFHPVAVHFKGSGFYNTDYGTRKRSREMTEARDGSSFGGDSSSSSDSKSGSGSDSGSGSSSSSSSSDSGSSSTSSSGSSSSSKTSESKAS